ncbi:hypothetical protein AVCANL277_09215, partial [Campylobacter canadensis]|uniref:hypothetical protein n=2 Tax=Campylobacter canadensis TaxID=449520 RepID=UPI001CC9575A
LSSYYTAQGKFDFGKSKHITTQTNVPLTVDTTDKTKATMKVGGADCLTVTASGSKITFKKATGTLSSACTATLTLPTVKAALGGVDLSTATEATIDLAASSVNFNF